MQAPHRGVCRTDSSIGERVSIAKLERRAIRHWGRLGVTDVRRLSFYGLALGVCLDELGDFFRRIVHKVVDGPANRSGLDVVHSFRA